MSTTSTVKIITETAAKLGGKIGADTASLLGVAVMIYYGQQELEKQGLLDVAISATLSKLITVTLAVVLMRSLILLMNKSLSFNMSEWMNNSETEDGARAIVLAARFISVAIITAAVLIGV